MPQEPPAPLSYEPAGSASAATARWLAQVLIIGAACVTIVSSIRPWRNLWDQQVLDMFLPAAVVALTCNAVAGAMAVPVLILASMRVRGAALFASGMAGVHAAGPWYRIGNYLLSGHGEQALYAYGADALAWSLLAWLFATPRFRRAMDERSTSAPA